MRINADGLKGRRGVGIGCIKSEDAPTNDDPSTLSDTEKFNYEGY